MSLRLALLLAPAALLSLVACGDKDEEDEEDEDDETVYSGACPQLDLGSAVGEAIATGSTRGGDNDWGDCGSAPRDGSEDSGSSYAQAPDVSLEWVAPDAGTYTAHTNGSRFDTLLTVMEGSCSGEVLDCDDDGGRNLNSAVVFEADAGQTYIFVIDGFGRSEDGDWEFSIEEGSPSWWGDSGDWGGDTGRRSRSLGKATRAPVPAVRTHFGRASVEVSIDGGAGGWMLGVAHTADLANPNAFLADCHTGAFVGGTWRTACQPVDGQTVELMYGGDPQDLQPGTTLLDRGHEGRVTWILESDREQGGDGQCFVWGHDPSAFAALRCVEL
jgi:hypothetical protein